MIRLDSYISSSLPISWSRLVPKYQSRAYRHLLFEFNWDSRYPKAIAIWSPKVVARRWSAYVAPIEVERVRAKLQTKKEASIRFGVRKDGQGFFGERGDFCILAGVIKGRNLQLMYRRLDLIRGLAYDLTVIDRLGEELGIKWKSVSIYAVSAIVFALKRNSNEALYPKLRDLFYTGNV